MDISTIYEWLSLYDHNKISIKELAKELKVKEISYVKDKEIEILSIPNAGKSDLLNLMYLNKL